MFAVNKYKQTMGNKQTDSNINTRQCSSDILLGELANTGTPAPRLRETDCNPTPAQN